MSIDRQTYDAILHDFPGVLGDKNSLLAHYESARKAAYKEITENRISHEFEGRCCWSCRQPESCATVKDTYTGYSIKHQTIDW